MIKKMHFDDSPNFAKKSVCHMVIIDSILIRVIVQIYLNLISFVISQYNHNRKSRSKILKLLSYVLNVATRTIFNYVFLVVSIY